MTFQTIEKRWGVHEWEDWFPAYTRNKRPVVEVRPVSFEELYPEITINQGRIYLKEQNNELKQRIQQLEQQLDMAREDSATSHRERLDALKKLNAAKEQIAELEYKNSRLAQWHKDDLEKIKALEARLDASEKALQQGQEKLKDALATQLAPRVKEHVIFAEHGEIAGIKGLVKLLVIPHEETKAEPKTVILGLHAGRPFEEIASDPDVPIEEKIAAHKIGVSKTFAYEFMKSYVKGA